MGLFHDVCNAFVRVSDGSALTGADLEEAECLAWTVDTDGHRMRLPKLELAQTLAERGWGICGHTVSKRARVCSKCGRGAPGGWIKCPACGKWVGNDSQYCPHCNHPLHPSERIDLAGGVWDREPDCYAQRFELDDVRFIREHGLQVQEGTSAILLDGGNEVKVLGAGRHTPTGTLRTINWLGNPPPRSAVMVDSGDVVFRVAFESDNENGPSLRSAENLAVSATAELTIRFLPSKAEAFMQNFMKDLRKVTAKDVCRWLYQESLSAVRTMCNTSTIEDLVKDPDRRERFEDAISKELKEPLARSGIEIVRVGAVEFFGEAYEDMRERFGELEKQRRLMEFEKKQMELVAEIERNDADDSERKDILADELMRKRTKRAHDAEEYLAQLAQEKDLGEIARAQELQIAVLVAKGEVSAEAARQQLARQAELHALELKGLTNKLELDAVVTDYDLADRIKHIKNDFLAAEIQNNIRTANAAVDRAVALHAAENEAAISRIKISAEIEETEKWLRIKSLRIDLDEKVKQAEFNRKLLFLNAIKGQPIETVIVLVDDPLIRADLLKLHERNVQVDLFKMQSTMSWEQLLGLAANNPNAAVAAAGANALGRMAEAGENASQEALKIYREAETANNLRIDAFVSQIHDIALQSVIRPSPVSVISSPTPTIMQH